MKKILILLITLVLASGMLFTSARALPVLLDFDMNPIQPSGATISYAGGSAALVGVDIGVDTVTGLNTPLNSGVTVDFHLTNPTDGAILSFTSGAFTSSGTGLWNFSGGGSLSVDLPLSGGGTLNLLSGTFLTAQVDSGIAGTYVDVSGFTDFKNTRLLNFYGLPTGIPYEGGLNLSFTTGGKAPGAFSSTRVLSGDLTNSPIPEPATMLLLGSGLLGMGVYARRRFTKK